MKIGFLSADWAERKIDGERVLSPGGSGWYRCHVPANAINEHTNHSAVVAEAFALVDGFGVVLRDLDGEEHPDCDIIVMQRLMHDYAKNIVRFGQEHGQVMCNDIDDWYWGLHPDNHAYFTTDPKNNPSINRNHYKEAILASDFVICSTPFLQERMNEWGVNTQLIRNAIDLNRWEFRSRSFDNPIFGWVGGTSHRSADLETLRGILGPFLERHGYRFHHSGHQEHARFANELLGVPREISTVTMACYLDQYPQQFQFLDVCVIPLNKIDFNEAKSAIKGLESAASGVPFVAQASGEYKRLAKYGIGMTANKPHHWLKALETMTDPGYLAAQAARNRELVEQFSIENRYVDWVEFFESIL